MFSLFPDFSPCDSYTLWYTSSRRPNPYHGTPNASQAQGELDGSPFGPPHQPNQRRHAQQQNPESILLARLRADEADADRRRQNLQNFGSMWLRPPGVSKTLHQLREEKREQEEHQEALRREQLVQELAEAEAAGAADAQEGAVGMMPAQDEGISDVQLDGPARDLDDDIPDADEASYGAFSSDQEEDEANDDDDDDDDEEANRTRSEVDDEARREQRGNELMQAQMRLVRGDLDDGDMYGADSDPDDEENHASMLDSPPAGSALGMMGMDVDLDDEIPDADGGYEHTDTEADMSSSERGTHGHDEDDDDDDDDDEDEDDLGDDDVFGMGMGMGSARRTMSLAMPVSPTLRARGAQRESGLRESMDLSSLLGDESSFLENNLHQGERM